MANNITLYTEKDLQDVVQLNRAMVDLMEEVFATLSSGKVSMPPILSLDIHEKNAEVDVKTAYVDGMDGFAVKISPGFFNNPQLGLPSLNGLMVYFDANTGLVKAVFLDNGYLTDIRTAAAGGLATRHLAPKDVKTAAVFGSGIQARLQAKAAHLERPFSRLLVHGRNRANAKICAQDLAEYFGDRVKVTVIDDAEMAVAESQLVITTTPARQALIHADWLHPNLHITAMGSDAEGKQELAPSVLTKADLYICDRITQADGLGEMQHLDDAEKSTLSGGRGAIEIGDILAKPEDGRQDDAQITIADLTGTGAQDTAIADFAYQILVKTNQGTTVEN